MRLKRKSVAVADVLLLMLCVFFAVCVCAQATAGRGLLQQTPPLPSMKMPAPQVPAPGSSPTAAPAAAPLDPAQVVEPLNPAGSAPLQVTVNKTILINTEDELKRVSVTDPTIADAVAVSLHQVMVHGRAPGEVTLILWDTAERSRSFDLRVDVDASGPAREIGRVFPNQDIQVAAVHNAIVLSGHVATKEEAERVGKVAEAFTKSITNVLTFGPVGSEEVLLEVKFAEVDRTALTQFGINLFSTGAANTFGATGTQQFGALSGASVGSVPSNVSLTGTPTGTNLITGAIGNTNASQPGVFGTNNLLNLFLFRSDLNLGATIQALQQQTVLQVLAEPNLIAVNGKEATFLAGGEFPFPVPQGISGAVTIQFKEFGVRLRFVPLIMPNGNIRLQVRPEVSQLDFTNALTLSGFVVPAISTRRAETEIELQDGQSFVIAGLLDNRVTNIISKVPGLGDIPVLGMLFKSKNLQKNKTELMVLVTARRVSPSTQPPPLPKFPYPFMNDTPARPVGK